MRVAYTEDYQTRLRQMSLQDFVEFCVEPATRGESPKLIVNFLDIQCQGKIPHDLQCVYTDI